MHLVFALIYFAYVIIMNIKVYFLVNFYTEEFLKFTDFNNVIVNADSSLELVKERIYQC